MICLGAKSHVIFRLYKPFENRHVYVTRDDISKVRVCPDSDLSRKNFTDYLLFVLNGVDKIHHYPYIASHSNLKLVKN